MYIKPIATNHITVVLENKSIIDINDGTPWSGLTVTMKKPIKAVTVDKHTIRIQEDI